MWMIKINRVRQHFVPEPRRLKKNSGMKIYRARFFEKSPQPYIIKNYGQLEIVKPRYGKTLKNLKDWLRNLVPAMS